VIDGSGAAIDGDCEEPIAIRRVNVRGMVREAIVRSQRKVEGKGRTFSF